ncbi:MAG: non-ribosomal peptide synthetase [bacterium]
MTDQIKKPLAATKNPAALIELLDQSCEKFKHRIAIECGRRLISYESLDRSANRLANQLIALNLNKGSIIAVVLNDRIQIITALIGILRAACVFVPFDPDGPEERLRQMLGSLAPACFIVDSDLRQSIAEGDSVFGCPVRVERVISLDDEEVTDAGAGAFDRPTVSHDPDDQCYVYYTSGSTGVPKGIVGRLKGLGHFINWEIDTFGIAAGTRVSQLTPPTFDAFLRDVLVPLCVGGTICIPPDRTTLMDPPSLIAWLDSSKINLIHCVPFIFNAIVHEHPQANKFTSLLLILMAGESLPASDVRKWINTYGTRIKLVNLYGPTEATMVKFYHVIEQSDLERGFIPIGKPMRGAKAILLDQEGNVCPPGVMGEIYIRTPYLTLGYYGKPELTREAFIPNPLTKATNDIVYKTGDLARVLSDGNFQFIGRGDNQVKIRGNRVELGEIETTLERHDLIRKAVLTVSDDLPAGSGLVAYVLSEKEEGLEIEQLRNFLSQRLPDYMMPAAFVQLDAFPLTPNGKVDRHALPPPGVAQELAKQFVAPRNFTEDMLAKIWQEVLNVDRIGVFDNFFQLGGHSLKATQVMSRVNAAFRIELPLHTLFETGNVAALTAIIEDHLIDELGEMSNEEAARLSNVKS